VSFVDQNLQNFYLHRVQAQLKTSPRVLEVGVGVRSIFSDLPQNFQEILSLDFNHELLEQAAAYPNKNSPHQFVCADFLGLSSTPFDLVFDAHCFHCLVKEDQPVSYLKKAHELLYPEGILAFECMIRKEFKSPVIDIEDLLWHSGEPIRYIPVSQTIEQMVQATGFELIFFRVNLSFLFTPIKSRPELCFPLLQVVAKKKA